MTRHRKINRLIGTRNPQACRRLDRRQEFPQTLVTAANAPTIADDRLEETTLLSPEGTDEDEARAVEKELTENALRPSRLRFALVCLLFIFAAGWSAINTRHALLRQSMSGDWDVRPVDGRLLVSDVGSSLADRLQLRDELHSLNGEPVTTVGRVYQLRNRLKPGERFTLQLMREGRAEEVEIVAQPLPRAQNSSPCCSAFCSRRCIS